MAHTQYVDKTTFKAYIGLSGTAQDDNIDKALVLQDLLTQYVVVSLAKMILPMLKFSHQRIVYI